MNRQLGYLDKLACSLIEFCIKRRDSSNAIYVFDFKTCWLNFHVNPAFDLMLSVENLYFCVLIT